MPKTRPARTTSAPPVSPRDRSRVALGALLLGGCLLIAYTNSFRVPFVLDDDSSIRDNPSIRSFASALFPPAGGVTVSGRPLLNFSFAVNHWLGGTAVTGYHVGNLLIHFLASLCFFGVVRRTLNLPVFAGRFSSEATALAWFASALWALHPLQTESVTYVVQRAESLVGLCYLFTLYAFIRSVEKPSRIWPVLTVLACFAGMAVKEVMVSAPVVLFFYDRTFVGGTFRESWRSRRGLYLGLVLSWCCLLGLMLSSDARGASVGFTAITPLEYALTQASGIATYVLHAILPVNLVFDYGAVVEKRPAVILAGLLVTGMLLAAAVVLLRKRPMAGFLGVWFFLILAPTSSIVPIVSQTLAEHRMYLPLGAIIVGITLAIHRFGAKLRWACLATLVIASVLATIDRNQDYRSNLSLWEDTVRKVPDNVRALNNLGLCYRDENRLDQAIRCFSAAVDLAPRNATTVSHLGAALVRKGLNRSGNGLVTTPPAEGSEFAAVSGGPQRDEGLIARGLDVLQKAIDLAPNDAMVVSHYGVALLNAGQPPAAFLPLQKAVSLAPGDWTHHFNLANALSELNRHEEARSHYDVAFRQAPQDLDVLINHGILLRRMTLLPEALEKFRAALQLRPDSARVHSNLGVALLARGQKEEAMRELTEALRLQPDLPQARYHLGNAFAETGRTEEAIEQTEALLKIVAPTAELLSNLGVLYARAGRLEDALTQTRRALELDPNHSAARENFARISAYLRTLPSR